MLTPFSADIAFMARSIRCVLWKVDLMLTYNKEMEVDKTFIDWAPIVALANFLGK